MYKLCLVLCLFLGCRYQFESGSDDKVVICVPYIRGDIQGQLNQMLIREISTCNGFKYSCNAPILLHITILEDKDEPIGYRYDRNTSSQTLRKNIVQIENRRLITAEIQLINQESNCVILGPFKVKANADFDYINSDVLADAVVVLPNQKTQRMIDFSLGQLDSVEGAHNDSAQVVYEILARKIVEALLAQKWQITES
jgi:hypothetical protein